MKIYLMTFLLLALPLLAQNTESVPAEADTPTEEAAPADAAAPANAQPASDEVVESDVTPAQVIDPIQPQPAPQAPNQLANGRVDSEAIHTPANFKLERLVMSGYDAADLYTRVTGKRVIVSSAAGLIETRFVQNGPLTNGDVARLLEKTLLLEGLAFVPDAVNPDEVKLVASGAVTNPNTVGFNVILDEASLPEGDQIVTYVMPFSNLKPEEALKIFQQVIGQFGGTGRIAAVTNASSLIVTENTGLIRQLIKIQKEIDVPSGVKGERWVEVEYADVDAVATQLNEIFNQTTQQNSARVQRANRNNIPVQNNSGDNNPAVVIAAGGDDGVGEATPLNILPDTRTNRILLLGRPADLVYVESLIKGFDQPSDGRNFFKYKLRYLRVNEFLDVAEQAIARTLGTDDAQNQAGQGAQGGQGGQQNRNNGQNNQNQNNRPGSGNTTAQADIQDIPTAPSSRTVGKTLLVADNLSNSIIVQGPPHHIEIVRNLLAELDSESEQVAISAVIGSYALGKNINFGIDLANIVQNASSSITLGGQSRNGVPSVVDPGTLGDLATLLAANGAAGNGVSLYGTVGNEFGFFVNALEANTNFKALATPTVFTKNNRVARLSSGQRIAIPRSTFTGNVNGGQTTNVDLVDVVLELEVQPLVNSDDEVTLEISLVRESVGQDRNVGELIVPDINSDKLTTTVTVPNGAAIILGGLITTQKGTSKTGVPILSSIPGIGRLFGTTKDTENRSELVIILRPEIIKSSYDLGTYRNNFEGTNKAAYDARLSLPPTDSGMLPAPGVMDEPEDSSKSGLVPRARVVAPAPAPVQPAPRKKILNFQRRR